MFLTAILLTASAASAVVRVEIAAEAGPQATAHREWLQLFAELGVTGARVRGARSGDEPRLEELGTADRPLPKLYAVLTRRGELLVPGAKFKLRDRGKLAEYLERLEKEGVAEFSAPRGRFGLTKEQFTEVYEALTPPLGSFEEGATLRDALRVLDGSQRVEVDRGAEAALKAPAVDVEKLKTLSRGTALALLLRQEGLVLIPEKPPGGEVKLRVAPALGAEESWPVGYKPARNPRQTAPVLFEFIPVEIRGFSLAEAVDAIAPRLVVGDEPLPVLWDHFALRRHAIDPAAVQVELPRTKTYYLRVFDKLLFQARLKSELKEDEAGTPFLLLTR